MLEESRANLLAGCSRAHLRSNALCRTENTTCHRQPARITQTYQHPPECSRTCELQRTRLAFAKKYDAHMFAATIPEAAKRFYDNIQKANADMNADITIPSWPALATKYKEDKHHNTNSEPVDEPAVNLSGIISNAVMENKGFKKGVKVTLNQSKSRLACSKKVYTLIDFSPTEAKLCNFLDSDGEPFEEDGEDDEEEEGEEEGDETVEKAIAMMVKKRTLLDHWIVWKQSDAKVLHSAKARACAS